MKMLNDGLEVVARRMVEQTILGGGQAIHLGDVAKSRVPELITECATEAIS